MQDIINDFTRLNELWFSVGFKVVLAIFCGGLIGWERQGKHKPAGLRTNMLICLGACLYTLLSIMIGADHFKEVGGIQADPARIAAQIVTGIGFLGGGMIIQSGGSISGLTSAATVWVVAAIGVGIGAGYPVMATAFTITVYLTLSVLSVFEHTLLGKMFVYRASILMPKNDNQSRSDVIQLFKEVDIEILQLNLSEQDEKRLVDVIYYCSEQRNMRIEAAIWAIPSIEDSQINQENAQRKDFA